VAGISPLHGAFERAVGEELEIAATDAFGAGGLGELRGGEEALLGIGDEGDAAFLLPAEHAGLEEGRGGIVEEPVVVEFDGDAEGAEEVSGGTLLTKEEIAAVGDA